MPDIYQDIQILLEDDAIVFNWSMIFYSQLTDILNVKNLKTSIG